MKNSESLWFRTVGDPVGSRPNSFPKSLLRAGPELAEKVRSHSVRQSSLQMLILDAQHVLHISVHSSTHTFWSFLSVWKVLAYVMVVLIQYL